MSLQGYVHQLRPRRESYVNYVSKTTKYITESSLSKGELQKPAGKGPNAGIPRIEIFADKITKGEEHLLNDGSSIVITQVTMNGEIYDKGDMNKFVTDFFKITVQRLSIFVCGCI